MIYQHEVISNTRLNHKFSLITFKSRSKKFSFSSGQFVGIIIAKDIIRFYSFASSPKDLPYWKIFVDTTPQGPGTSYLTLLKPGEKILTQSANGHLTLNSRMEEVVLGATGCGLAPFISFLEQLKTSNKIKVRLYWGLRYKKDIALLEYFDSYSKSNPNFSLEIVLSKNGQDWKGKTGHVQEYLLNDYLLNSKKHLNVFLSGSSDFVLNTKQELEKNGYIPSKIHIESCY